MQPSVLPKQSSNPIEAMLDFVSEDMAAVNQLIIKRLANPIDVIPKLAGHLINAGGKRIRPLLALATAAACGDTSKRQIALSACIEFIHTATLLHDDVVDDNDCRRGQETANIIWGNPATVLVGDYLFTKSFELMVEDGDPEVLRVLSKAASTIVEGEVLQLTTNQDTSKTYAQYTSVISAKTAELFAAACHIGALVAGQPKDVQQAFVDFGWNLGMAYQVVDDVLDYTANQEILGKPLGVDFVEGKMTFPVIYAYEVGTEEQRSFWDQTMDELEQEEGDFEKAVEILHATGAFERSYEKATEYTEQAKAALARVPDSIDTNLFADVASYCVRRDK
ncbi:MAG: polyprenyl synthetase family protein [Alphaproteobacteria bacterium]